MAHHSCAIIEAEEYGLAANLAREFKPAPRGLADALIYCDMTTSPDGQRMTIEQRLADIRARYGPAPPRHQRPPALRTVPGGRDQPRDPSAGRRRPVTLSGPDEQGAHSSELMVRRYDAW